ncbi:hypothetical protein PDK45_25590 [Bacillus cereus]|nr:hypothetical protein [Bacillus cereus]
MTAIIAIMVQRPKGKPFIQIVSDSKRTTTDLPGSETYRTEENDAKKIFKINKTVITISGSFDPHYQINLIKELSINTKKDISLVSFTEFVLTYTKSYIETAHPDVGIKIVIGKIESNVPKMSSFIATKNKDISADYIEIPKNNLRLIMNGENPPKYLLEKYENPSLYGDFSPPSVRKVAEEYLTEMHRLHPNTCNEIFQSTLVI